MSFGFGRKVEMVAACIALAVSVGCKDDPTVGGGDDEGTSGGSADDDDDGGSDTGEEQTLDPAIMEFVTARCDRVESCDCAGALPLDECVDAQALAWEARIAAGEAAGLTRDDACITTNLATLATADCRWPAFVLSGDEHLCNQFCGVFYGTKSLGQACQAYDSLVSDCAQGLLCDVGTCVEPCSRLTGLAVGTTCGTELNNPFEDCTVGTYCDYTTYTCQAFAQVGADCSMMACAEELWCDWMTSTCLPSAGPGEVCWEINCQDDLQCDYSMDMPTCRAPALEGEPCTGISCADGLACNGTICTQLPTIGQQCAQGSCAEGSLCDWNTNECVAMPSVGTTCLFDQCADDLWCDNATDPEGICSVQIATGEECTGHSQCESQYCPRGYCEERPAEGEDCSVLFACDAGLVCNGTTCQPTQFRGPAACVYPGW